MKKKIILLFVFILTTLFGFSQNYELIDKKVSNYPNYTDIQTLSIRIINDFNSDEERVRAIFSWITQNISYNTNINPYVANGLKSYFSEYQKARDLKKEKKEKMNSIMKTKKAMCYGYSLLFKNLCEKIEVKSKIIYGYTRTNPKIIGINRTYKDHAWNLVKINNEWKIIDVTWASGYEDIYSKRFVKRFNDYYFFTDPNNFIKHHLALNPKNQLTNKPTSKDEFFSKPIFYPEYFKTNIQLSSKHNGIINVNNSNNAITINFDKVPKKIELHYMFMDDISTRKLHLKKEKKGGFKAKIKYKNTNDSNLTIFSNLEAILCFKIEVKNYLHIVKQ